MNQRITPVDVRVGHGEQFRGPRTAIGGHHDQRPVAVAGQLGPNLLIVALGQVARNAFRVGRVVPLPVPARPVETLERIVVRELAQLAALPTP